ncbi:hypothetical protein RJ55_08039 [Drechmeria coniospora]|nr:hypothetical protein RJ55_08039 [Drechmeria coniospora]
MDRCGRLAIPPPSRRPPAFQASLATVSNQVKGVRCDGRAQPLRPEAPTRRPWMVLCFANKAAKGPSACGTEQAAPQAEPGTPTRRTGCISFIASPVAREHCTRTVVPVVSAAAAATPSAPAGGPTSLGGAKQRHGFLCRRCGQVSKQVPYPAGTACRARGRAAGVTKICVESGRHIGYGGGEHTRTSHTSEDTDATKKAPPHDACDSGRGRWAADHRARPSRPQAITGEREWRRGCLADG